MLSYQLIDTQQPHFDVCPMIALIPYDLQKFLSFSQPSGPLKIFRRLEFQSNDILFHLSTMI